MFCVIKCHLIVEQMSVFQTEVPRQRSNIVWLPIRPVSQSLVITSPGPGLWPIIPFIYRAIRPFITVGKNYFGIGEIIWDNHLWLYIYSFSFGRCPLLFVPIYRVRMRGCRPQDFTLCLNVCPNWQTVTSTLTVYLCNVVIVSFRTGNRVSAVGFFSQIGLIVTDFVFASGI